MYFSRLQSGPHPADPSTFVHLAMHRIVAAPRPAPKVVLPGQMLDEDDKLEVIARRYSKACVAVGERTGFAGELIAAALVPSDESMAHIDDGHLNGARS